VISDSEVVGFVAARSRWSPLREDSSRFWRRGAVTIRADGLWELDRGHDAVRSARTAVRDRIGNLRRWAAMRPDPAALKAHQARIERERAEHGQQLTRLRRVLLHAFPASKPEAVVLLDVDDRAIETYIDDEIAEVVARLADGRDDAVSPALVSNLESTVSDPREMLSAEVAAGRPTLETPSIVAVIQAGRRSIKLQTADRDAMLDAIRVAAERRIDAILSHSRRRHYGHAAMLAATCVALAPTGRRQEFINWIAALHRTHSRRSAFRQELTRALESLGVRNGPERAS
jgi:hypothetical protein